MIKNVDMVFLLGHLEMFIKVITSQMLEMDLGRCIGVMVVFIRGNGKMGYKMERGRFMYRVKDIKEDYFKIIYWWFHQNRDN
jgi:hypothetical protein